MQNLSHTARLVALVIYVLAAWLLFFVSSGQAIPTGSGISVWFLAATAYWLLRLVAAPFFSPPRDALGLSISVVLLLAPMDFTPVVAFHWELVVLNGFAIVLAIVVAVAALIAAFAMNTATGRFFYRVSSELGRGEVLLTPAVIVSAVGFYEQYVGWTYVIIGLWAVVTVTHPVESLIRLAGQLLGSRDAALQTPSGRILRVDDPNILRVSLTVLEPAWEAGNIHYARLPDGTHTYVVPLFRQTQDDEVVGTGLCCPADGADLPPGTVGDVYPLAQEGLSDALAAKLSGEAKLAAIVGIVVEGSSIGSVRFQVIDGHALEEGMVVFAYVRERKIYYQILDARTDEESFQQNPLGTQIATAVQLGSFDPGKGFIKFPWLPGMNQPLFLVGPDEVFEHQAKDGEFILGHVPNTNLGLPIVADDLVEYHTAVLGTTGTGKTELTLDIIRNVLARGTKVFCVDFTGEYKQRLADLKPQTIGAGVKANAELAKLLFEVETGEYNGRAERKPLKEFLDRMRPYVAKQIETFLADHETGLGLFELAEITNTKATLRATELYLSAIMEWARQNRKAQRVLIVLEEAHTIVPEPFGSGFDPETQWVVGRIGQIALQGRKFGVGLLLVSQRTALVSKTVLSQCNTYFIHNLVDKTSLDYVSSIVSPEYLPAIPNLRFLEFIAVGKAVRSDRPVLAVRDFDPEKEKASQALNAKKAAAVEERPINEGLANAFRDAPREDLR